MKGSYRSFNCIRFACFQEFINWKVADKRYTLANEPATSQYITNTAISIAVCVRTYVLSPVRACVCVRVCLCLYTRVCIWIKEAKRNATDYKKRRRTRTMDIHTFYSLLYAQALPHVQDFSSVFFDF